MNNNIQKTKTKLSIIFTVIIFILILLFWVTFFSIKYFRWNFWDKLELNTFTHLFKSWKIIPEHVLDINNFLSKNIREKPFAKKKWFVNYILLDNKNNIISSNIKDSFNYDLLNEIILDNKYYDLQYSSDFFIKKIQAPNRNWNFVFLKKINYTKSEYISDLLLFLLIDLFFAIIFYYWGKTFISRLFKPIEQNLSEMKDFVHNAWHELKTPISVMDSNIQLIDDEKNYNKELTTELKNELLRLNSIIDWLIRLSNIDNFKDSEKINLFDEVSKITSEYKSKMKEKNINVSIDIDSEVFIEANNNYFHIFLSNIIWNSIKYNIENWKINISYYEWKLIIKDTWVWICKKDIEKIFNRFYKCDTSRNSEWFWIWLSLVRKIADIYAWKIIVESKKDKWSVFTIDFN